MNESIIDRGIFFGGNFSKYKSLEEFVYSSKNLGIIDNDFYVKSETYGENLNNIDMLVICIKDKSTGRDRYVVINNKIYKLDVFAAKDSLLRVVKPLLDKIEERITRAFENKEETILHLLNAVPSEKEIQENRVYKDTKYIAPNSTHFYRLNKTDEGALLVLNTIIEYGFLDKQKEINYEAFVEKIVNTKRRDFYSMIYKPVSDSLSEEECYFDNFLEKLSRTYLLWGGEYTSDMNILKNKCIEKIAQTEINYNKRKYGKKLNEVLNSKCIINYRDNFNKLRRVQGVVEDIDYKNKTLRLKNTKNSYDILFDNINKVEK